MRRFTTNVSDILPVLQNANKIMSSKILGQEAKQWHLASGLWSVDAQGVGFVLHKSAQGRPVSSVLTSEDLRSLLKTGRSVHALNAQYPPEFKFCSASGVALEAGITPEPAAWIPPFGVAMMSPRASRAVRGLRQASMPLKLIRQSQRQADSDPDAKLVMPPPGNYQFFSIPACTRSEVLLALDPAKGHLYAFLPASQRWEALESDGIGLLSESLIDQAAWRCETVIDGLSSLIFLPSKEGLACLRPDVPGLGFSVQYIGGVPAIGGPLQFGDSVWLPLQTTDGGVRFVSANANGESGAVVELPLSGLAGFKLGQIHASLADGRTALWLSDAGQLLLRKQASGDVDASFQPWPEDMQPAFEFGSPYLSRDGSLWQLCFDGKQESYVYLQLGVETCERVPALTPRMCSGVFNFRFATKFKSEPWLEPEHGDDGQSDEIVLPFLESTLSSSVLGLRLKTTAGLADVLRSTERLRAVLVLDDASSQTAFHTIAVSEPWRLRLFVHDGLLWAYHPLLSRIDGWALEL